MPRPGIQIISPGWPELLKFLSCRWCNTCPYEPAAQEKYHCHHDDCPIWHANSEVKQDITLVYVVPTGMEEAPKVALDIHCLQRGSGAALTQTINLIPPPRGDGGTQALTA